MDVFDRAWKVLETKGLCDAMGGAEYTRLRGGWDRVMGVLIAIDFIQSGANKPPTPELLPDAVCTSPVTSTDTATTHEGDQQ